MLCIGAHVLAALTHSQIQKHFPEVPLGTIKTTLRREAQLLFILRSSAGEGGSPDFPTTTQSRKYIPTTIRRASQERDQIFDTVTTDPHLTMRDLLDSVDNVVKLRSLRYLLREMNKRKWILDWARRYQGIDWRRVKWSDECMDVREARRQGAVQQMFWAAFGHVSRTPLVPLVGNANAVGIYNLYAFILPWFLQSGDIFMHDNASVHTARVVKFLLEGLGVELMAWSPYSPDLNPIENLWALLKAEIYRSHPELTHAEDTVATEHALVLAAMEAWDNLEERVLKNLCETMPNHVDAVITAEGWYTRY
ncbi:Uncharacterized protein HZ326_26973 [Fusarium oxysporum f. sp. albedinis]|nr:Uncharacterized protein HZ326_26973 [Fusarium oxysporum f. sp. albedinis]